MEDEPKSDGGLLKVSFRQCKKKVQNTSKLLKGRQSAGEKKKGRMTGPQNDNHLLNYEVEKNHLRGKAV
jgi:hypothetical protein